MLLITTAMNKPESFIYHPLGEKITPPVNSITFQRILLQTKVLRVPPLGDFPSVFY